MLEHEIQNRFIDYVIGKEEIIKPEKNHLEIYKNLVYYRFYEVLKNVYPIFKKEMGDETFHSLIHRFVKNTTQEPLIWKMPDEFRRFCLRQKDLADVPPAEDILLYEWIEVELLMGNYTALQKNERTIFSWEQSFKFSDSARCMTLTYQVYTHEFKTPGKFPVILYYNFSEHHIHFQEITLFLFDLISAMGYKTAFQALAEKASLYNLNVKETGDIIFETLNDYCLKKILVRV